jgi:hypothetical protein
MSPRHFLEGDASCVADGDADARERHVNALRGSLHWMWSVAFFVPAVAGANWSCTTALSPGATLKGAPPAVTAKSPAAAPARLVPPTKSCASPALRTTRACVAVPDPARTPPKSRLAAARTISGSGGGRATP